MARGSEYTYNPQTGKWTKSSQSTQNSTNKTKTTTKKDGDNLTSDSTNKNDSTGSVEKKYNTIELNTLSGTLNFISTKQTIKLKAGDTVKILGIGKYLSGNYYVQDIVRQISANGYSHSATLIKTDFGKSLKKSTSTTKKKTSTTKKTNNNKTTKVSSSSSSKDAKRTYTVKKGDCLWNIAVKFYGNGSKWKKIYDANTNKIANPNLIYVGQVFVIP